MKKLLIILLLLTNGSSYSQNFIEHLINYSKDIADKKIENAIGKEIFDKNFKFNKSKTIIEIYNNEKEMLQRISLLEFNKSKFQATQFWLTYEIIDDNIILSDFSFPFNLNYTTPWDLKVVKELTKPYSKVLSRKVKIDLKKALEISNKNGLNKMLSWDIDYEKKKLIWTIKSIDENKQSKMIKINAKNGKIISEYIEIPID